MKEKWIFKMKEKGRDQIVIEVNKNLTPLDIAKHPYLDSTYVYITVSYDRDRYNSRFVNNTNITIIKKDGTTFAYQYGTSTSCVADRYWKLRDKVMDFINGVPLCI